jgi:hypothetical protein
VPCLLEEEQDEEQVFKLHQEPKQLGLAFCLIKCDHVPSTDIVLMGMQNGRLVVPSILHNLGQKVEDARVYERKEQKG